MADNFLERHRADYEQRKARWLKKKSRCQIKVKRPATDAHADKNLSEGQT